MVARVSYMTLMLVVVVATLSWGGIKPGPIPVPVPVPFAVPEEIALYQPKSWPNCYDEPAYLACVQETSTWKCEIREPEPPPSSRDQWHWSCRDRTGRETYVGTRSPYPEICSYHLNKCGQAIR